MLVFLVPLVLLRLLSAAHSKRILWIAFEDLPPKRPAKKAREGMFRFKITPVVPPRNDSVPSPLATVTDLDPNHFDSNLDHAIRILCTDELIPVESLQLVAAEEDRLKSYGYRIDWLGQLVARLDDWSFAKEFFALDLHSKVAEMAVTRYLMKQGAVVYSEETGFQLNRTYPVDSHVGIVEAVPSAVIVLSLLKGQRYFIEPLIAEYFIPAFYDRMSDHLDEIKRIKFKRFTHRLGQPLVQGLAPHIDLVFRSLAMLDSAPSTGYTPFPNSSSDGAGLSLVSAFQMYDLSIVHLVPESLDQLRSQQLTMSCLQAVFEVAELWKLDTKCICRALLGDGRTPKWELETPAVTLLIEKASALGLSFQVTRAGDTVVYNYNGISKSAFKLLHGQLPLVPASKASRPLAVLPMPSQSGESSQPSQSNQSNKSRQPDQSRQPSQPSQSNQSNKSRQPDQSRQPSLSSQPSQQRQSQNHDRVNLPPIASAVIVGTTLHPHYDLGRRPVSDLTDDADLESILLDF